MGIIIGEKGKSSFSGGVYAGKKSVRKMLWEKGVHQNRQFEMTHTKRKLFFERLGEDTAAMIGPS